MMPLENIEDWDKRLARIDAFWTCDIVDRPVVRIVVPKKTPDYRYAPRQYASHRQRWFDPEHVAKSALAQYLNNDYFGDSVPFAWPNLGPEVFSAFFGQELEYGPETAWSLPFLKDWDDVERIQFSENNPYWKKAIELTDALLDAGKGKFYVGITDIHPGGDAIAAFRDPQEMCLDMICRPKEIKALLKKITPVFFHAYNFYYDKLIAAGQATCSWPPFVSTKKWSIPSNDFSCMISKEMYDEFFLPDIIAECRHMDATIYHLDGPNALQHLDSLLAIKELNAIQWVYGAGNGRASDWLDIYKKCQAAGKALQIEIEPNELETMIENLRPEGINLGIYDVTDPETATALVKRVAQWR
jgi:hypothetical protein